MAMSLVLMLSMFGTWIAYAQDAQAVVRSERVELNAGDMLIVHSDQNSIQRIAIEGNITNGTLLKPTQYPANQFGIATTEPGTLAVRAFFNLSSDYIVTVTAQTSNESTRLGNSTYYMSGGPFELDLTIVVGPHTTTDTVPAVLSPWDAFTGWVGKFGEAFPFWVKALYLILGVQFFAVGGLWIRRETSRKESSPQSFDSGDKIYLWIDIAYKFLLVSFLAIVLIMGGELLALFVLRFMFLAALDLLSLWDLFVVGFAAGIVIIAYALRFTLEKAFDLKPMEED